jgi:co-chaperonin GroES (HSP10)
MKALELSDKQLKNILNISISLFAVFLFVKSFIIDTNRSKYERSLKNIREQSFEGIVIDKGFEKFNHNASMIYLSNNRKFAVFGQFWAEIKIGDSLVKKKGETIITVYRNKEKFVLDNKDVMNSWKK